MSKDFQQSLEKIVEKLLPKTCYFRKTDILIKDPLWGSIKLLPHEAALIDTLLWQRLRYIRQLGATYMVFPGAQHTRFEHSVGVLHLTALAGNNLLKEGAINEFELMNLRVAALCHDLGHGPFSHDSESVFSKLPPFNNKYPGAAEVVSAAILKTHAFAKFLDKIHDAFPNLELDIDFIAGAIVGDLPKNLEHLSTLIHGPFDTDKLDYLNRDGHFCGIKSNVEIDRIINLLTIRKHNNKKILIGSRGSAATLFQLAQNRQYLFAVVIQHPVVRAFSAMIRTALQIAIDTKVSILDSTLTTPADFLTLNDSNLLSASTQMDGPVAELLSAITNRQMYKSAVRIDCHGLDKKMSTYLEKNQTLIANEIATQAKLAKHQVIVDLAKTQNNKEVNEMLIDRGDKIVTLADVLGKDHEKNLLHTFMSRHQILCPQQHRTKVAKIATSILSEKIPKSSIQVKS